MSQHHIRWTKMANKPIKENKSKNKLLWQNNFYKTCYPSAKVYLTSSVWMKSRNIYHSSFFYSSTYRGACLQRNCNILSPKWIGFLTHNSYMHYTLYIWCLAVSTVTFSRHENISFIPLLCQSFDFSKVHNTYHSSKLEESLLIRPIFYH